MAEAAALRHNIEVSLAILDDEIGALPERVGDEDGPWSDGWPTYMARFEWLVDLADEGRLAPTEQTEYTRLLSRLRDYLPFTEQLGLYVPRKLLDAIGLRPARREVA